MAVRRTPVPARFLVKQRQWVASIFGIVVLVSLLLGNAVQLNAIPVLTQTILFNNSIGAVSGSFDGGGNTLAALADLTDASAAPREYVSQFFKPVMSGTYVFGLSSSNEDTVLILYEGEFDPKSPQSRATLINDDSDGVGPGGVVITSCGANKTLCPKISTSLTGGQIYTIVVTSYLPSVTISDGVGFYIYGEPVLIGTQKQENATDNLGKIIRVQTWQILSNFLSADDEYAAAAMHRHIASERQIVAARRGDQTAYQNTQTTQDSRHVTLQALDQSVNSTASLMNIYRLDKNSRMITQGEFRYAKDKTDNISKHMNVRVAFEHFDWRRGTLGAAVGASFSKSSFFSPKPSSGENNFIFTTLNGVKTLRDDLFIETHLSVGLGKGTVRHSAGLEQWNSTYDSRLVSMGLSTSGVIEVKRYAANGRQLNFEIWPTLSLQHGSVKSSDIRTDFNYGGIFEMIEVVTGDVKTTKLTLTPKFKFDLSSGKRLFMANHVAIEPSLICTHTRAEIIQKGCGFGLSFGLKRKKDSDQFFRMQLQNSGDGKSLSAAARLSIPF
ncbi:MAG: hypothetical protein ACPG6Q_05150 [Candidatus Puniceispirillaceae bacterium]